MAPEHMRPAMNELRWTELAALVVAWHNRHPLARRIGVQHVHSLGYVMLPFVDEAQAPAAAAAATPRAVPGGAEALPPEAMTGSLRERAMARAQLDAQGAAATPTAEGSPPSLTAPVQLRPAFDEDFIPPHAPKAVRRWAARQAVAQATPRGDVQVRKVRPEAGVDESAVLPRWVLTAQVDAGPARTRVLVGPGDAPVVLGRRLISPGRTLLALLLVTALALAASWAVQREPAPVAVPVVASVAASVPAALPAPVVASAPVAASAPAPTPTPTPASAPMSASAPAAAAAPALPPSPPLDVEPQLGKVDLPSLGPRIEERRRRAQEAASAAAASAASTAPAAAQGSHAPPAAPKPQAAAPAAGPSFAVATRLLRTRSESEQLAAAMRELLSKQAGAAVKVDVLPVGDDWRVVGWPYADKALAEKAQALLASRGMKVQVIDF